MKDILDMFQEEASVAGLWQMVRDYYHDHAIDKISYHHLERDESGRSTIAVTADGFPEDWVCHYIDSKLYLVDPIKELAQSRIRPFLWSDIEKLAKLSPDQLGYLRDMADAKLGDGLAFQVYGPGFRNGFTGLGFAENDMHPSTKKIHEFQIVAQAAHVRYCELVPLGPKPSGLSRREREILQWIARGKSNSAIASILSVSPHTIDTLVRRIFDKLDVSDRTTAAILGVGSGLVLP